MSTSFSRILTCYLIQSLPPPLMFSREIYEFLKTAILKNTSEQLLLYCTTQIILPHLVLFKSSRGQNAQAAHQIDLGKVTKAR